MKIRILAFLLTVSLLAAMLPGGLAEEITAPLDEIEAAIPEITGEGGGVSLEELTKDGDREETTGDGIEAEAAFAGLSAGYARVIEPLNAVYDDDFILVAENLPVDTVVYVESVEADGRARVAYCVGEEAVRAWMDASALAALDDAARDALLSEAAACPEGFTYADAEMTLPLPKAAVGAPELSQALMALTPGGAQRLTIADGRPVTWSTDEPRVATVDEDGTVTAVNLGEATITAEDAQGRTATCKVRVAMLAVASVLPDRVRFNVSKLSIGLGEVYDGLEVILGSEEGVDYISDLTFESSKPKYVTVDEDGVLVGVKKGSSNITVRTSNGLKASCKVTVKSAPSKVTVSPASVKLNAGESKALTAKLNSSSASGTILWSSSDEDVAEVDERTGVVTAVGPGKAIVTAEAFNGRTGEAAVTVRDEPTSLTFEDEEIVLGVKQKVVIQATLNPGAECDIQYATNNPGVVSVKGDVLTAVSEGTATIRASTYNGLTAFVDILVEPAPKSVKLPFNTLYLGAGETFQLEPEVDGSDIGLTYTVNKKSYFSVSNDGLITALKAGTGYVTIKTYNGKSFRLKVIVSAAPKSLSMSPTSLDMSVGDTEQLTFRVSSNTNLTLTSSNPAVAVVDDETGEVTAVGSGTAVITAETYNGLTATCQVKVSGSAGSIRFVEDHVELAANESVKLEVEMTGGRSKVSFSSEDTRIATVSDTGVVTGKAAGQTVIHATTPVPGVSAEAVVVVWSAPDSVKLKYSKVELGVDEQFQLEPIIPDGTRATFIYSSSDEQVATVDADGVVTGVGLGNATITVRTHNGKSATMKVYVLDPYAPESIKVVGTVPTLEIGEEWQIVYSISPASAVTDVTWSSSDRSVVTVDEDGWIYAVGKGTATITAVATRNSKCRTTVNVKVVSTAAGQELCTAIPARITKTSGIEDNLSMIEDIRQSALFEIDRMVDEGEISASDGSKRAAIVNNIFDCYAFPWMTLRYQDYWKEKNSEGGVKDFKPGNVYYGLPYISGSGDNRHYNVDQALAENRYYYSGEGYYILNQNNLLKGKYVGNDCSGLVDVAIWGTDSSHSDDRTDDIAKNSAYRTINDFKAMRTGDLICKGGSHVVMFLYYVNDAKTEFMMIENGGAEAGTNTVHCDIYNANYYINGGYKVRRLATLG